MYSKVFHASAESTMCLNMYRHLKKSVFFNA